MERRWRGRWVCRVGGGRVRWVYAIVGRSFLGEIIESVLF